MLNVTKRTKNLLKSGAVVLLLGVGARIYAEVYGPQKRPLGIKLTRDSESAWAITSGKSLVLPLKIVGHPPAREGSIEGPRAVWTLESFQHRASPAEPWRDYSSKNERYSLLQRMGDHAMLQFPDGSPGEWKARVHAEVEYWDGESKDTWLGATTREFEAAYSTADLARIAARKQGDHRAIIEAAEPPTGAVLLVEGKKYISKLQYTEDSVTHWQDVPLPGSPNYPLLVDQHTVLSFRAVKINPQEKWPHYPKVMPQWERGDGRANFGGELVYLHFNLKGTKPELQTVTARCGNQVSTQVQVLPKSNGNLLFVSDKDDLALGDGNRFNQASLTLHSDHAEPAYKNARVRLSAQYSDGKPADIINGPGTQDDIVPLDNRRLANATLHARGKPARVLVNATLIDPDGKSLSKVEQSLEIEVHANWWAREQEAVE